MDEWVLRQWGETDVRVGACAWHVSMLADEAKAAHVRRRPSLVVVLPDDDDERLAAARPHLGDLPVMLIVAEPDFARRLATHIEHRAGLLGRAHVDVLAMAVDDPADLKGGGMLQVMFDLRQRGFCKQLGLAHDEERHAEWLARHTAVRVLGVDFLLANQQVAYRALDAAREHGMSCVAIKPVEHDDAALRFALGAADRVLPLLDRPLPEGVAPMSADELAEAWVAYQKTHSEPAPLLRSQPPE